jgi:acyl carrier protein
MTWNLVQVETEIVAIVAELSPGWRPDQIGLATRFDDDLGWDEWYILSVVKKVRKRLHETLSDPVVKNLKVVGDLVKYVWSKMEEVP